MLVIVERYPAPAAKPPTIIYEKYLPTPAVQRPIVVKREICQPVGCPIVRQQIPARQVIRQVTQVQSAPHPAMLCFPQQQQQQQQAVQQLVPVFATRQVSFDREYTISSHIYSKGSTGKCV